MTEKERALALGNVTPKFTKLCDDGDPVANYLDQQIGESDLIEWFSDDESEPLVYGFIATNWHLEHKISYELVYLKLLEKAPVTQDEFDECLAELQLLVRFDKHRDN